MLGMISFLTVGEDEVRAWPIRIGTPASKAAGKIHTDLKKGFIRGEVVHYKDLEISKSLSECKKSGQLRQEKKDYKKDYIVKDGDVMNVLFNI